MKQTTWEEPTSETFFFLFALRALTYGQRQTEILFFPSMSLTFSILLALFLTKMVTKKFILCPFAIVLAVAVAIQVITLNF